MWEGRTVDALDEVARTLEASARADVKRLRDSLAYAAPEVREDILWRGGASSVGLVDLCCVHGTNATRPVYANIVAAVEERSRSGQPTFRDVVR